MGIDNFRKSVQKVVRRGLKKDGIIPIRISPQIKVMMKDGKEYVGALLYPYDWNGPAKDYVEEQTEFNEIVEIKGWDGSNIQLRAGEIVSYNVSGVNESLALGAQKQARMRGEKDSLRYRINHRTRRGWKWVKMKARGRVGDAVIKAVVPAFVLGGGAIFFGWCCSWF